MEYIEKRIVEAKEAIEECEHIIIGGGAGLSAAAGLTYSGKRFEEHFADFKEKYGFSDMYAGTFYPFESEEELWAHWARHIDVNRYLAPSTKLYQRILELVKGKEFFVITTNVESQFTKAGFPMEKVFEVQGNYAYLQCGRGCHDKLYYNEKRIKKMVLQTKNCRIPTNLVPRCPVCHEEMDVNLRHNGYFVQDKAWYKACKVYEDFLKESQNKKTVFLEMGVGFNTPGIIRYPFEQMTDLNQKSKLIRFNKDYPLSSDEISDRTISFDEDISEVLEKIRSLK